MNLFNFGDVAKFGSNDFETIDGFHGSEVCYLRMMKVMSQQGEVFAQYLNDAKVNELFENFFSFRKLVKGESVQAVTSNL